MRTLIALLLVFALSSCTMPGPRYGNHVVLRDWTTFVRPPAGTPVLLRVFGLYGPNLRQVRIINLPGTWQGKESPFSIEFPVWRDLDGIVRVEVHFRGEVIAAKDFDPPTMFTKGASVGWRR